MVSETYKMLAGSDDPNVLILVLVEDGLGVTANWLGGGAFPSLNPCFSGGWSRRCGREDI